MRESSLLLVKSIFLSSAQTQRQYIRNSIHSEITAFCYQVMNVYIYILKRTSIYILISVSVYHWETEEDRAMEPICRWI